MEGVIAINIILTNLLQLRLLRFVSLYLYVPKSCQNKLQCGILFFGQTHAVCQSKHDFSEKRFSCIVFYFLSLTLEEVQLVTFGRMARYHQD